MVVGGPVEGGASKRRLGPIPDGFPLSSHRLTRVRGPITVSVEDVGPIPLRPMLIPCRRSRMLRTWCLALVMGALVVVGCADDPTGRQELLGSVSYRGEPLSLATVQFRPEDGSRRMAVVATVHAGQFRVPAVHGLTPGRYRIIISAVDESAPEGSPARERLPTRYNSASTMVVEVVPGQVNSFDFALD